VEKSEDEGSGKKKKNARRKKTSPLSSLPLPSLRSPTRKREEHIRGTIETKGWLQMNTGLYRRSEEKCEQFFEKDEERKQQQEQKQKKDLFLSLSSSQFFFEELKQLPPEKQTDANTTSSSEAMRAPTIRRIFMFCFFMERVFEVGKEREGKKER
jgi:hypothetical protein